jgi:hypothetical protein
VSTFRFFGTRVTYGRSGSIKWDDFLGSAGEPRLVPKDQMNHNAVASHHVVVIAHSMGGILAHTLVSDSGDTLWNSFATKPLNRLALSPEEKKWIAELLLLSASTESFFWRCRIAVVAWPEVLWGALAIG